MAITCVLYSVDSNTRVLSPRGELHMLSLSQPVYQVRLD